MPAPRWSGSAWCLARIGAGRGAGTTGRIDRLNRQVESANVPGSVRAMQADLERNFEALLGSTFDKMDLVTREEFDVQRRVLERTREKLGKVEAELAALEHKLGVAAGQ
ncbi:MAG: hypothetical protein DYH20_14180 [Gammaproteobacteria bacterium PRO9]|nr:hypothetical protein [Gammaproteobacteria bacterium PRO9]